MFQVFLPFLGKRWVQLDKIWSNHYIWLDSFGWHDCSPSEDAHIQKFVST